MRAAMAATASGGNKMAQNQQQMKTHRRIFNSLASLSIVRPHGACSMKMQTFPSISLLSLIAVAIAIAARIHMRKQNSKLMLLAGHYNVALRLNQFV